MSGIVKPALLEQTDWPNLRVEKKLTGVWGSADFRRTAAVILLLQALLPSITFPLSELWTQKPLFRNDAAFHWYESKLAVDFAKTGDLIGFDPFFNAGYIGGIHSNSSGKFAAAMSVLLHPWLNEIVVYKLVSIAAALAGPLCVPIALAWLGLSRAHVITGSVLGFLMWW